MEEISKLRIDRWLWAVRIFKTRSMSTIACNAGKVKVNARKVKPSYKIKLGDTITIQKGIVKFAYNVRGLVCKRVSAKIAATHFKDITPEEEKFKMKTANQSVGIRNKGLGRPSKKDRREIEKYRWRN